MPRFYLTVCNDVRAIDDEGEELPDLEAATSRAVQGARELIAEQVLAGRPISQEHCIEIADTEGTVLHTVYFAEVIQLRP
jgi:hypothetical protein